eukprot:403373070
MKDKVDGEVDSDQLFREYSTFGFLMIGLHNFLILYYTSIKWPELKIRYQKLKENRRLRQEKEDQETSGLYLIFEKNEQKPLEKVYSKLQEFYKLIPISEKEIQHEMRGILKILKEVLENQRSSIMQNDKMLKGAKRIGDREEVKIGSGMLRAKLSNLGDIMHNLDIRRESNNLQPMNSELDDDQQYYSDIQKRIISTNNGNRLNSSQRNSINNSSKEFTVDPIKLSKYLKDYNRGIELCLDKIDSFEFDIFNLRAISSGRELLILGYEIAQKSNLIELNQISKFVYLSFLQGIAQSYNMVAYHNKTHAGDVLQGLHYFLYTGRIAELLKLSPLEHIGAIVAAISHDVDHPGFNNQFLVSTKDEIAILYNDQSVLENHHVAQTFLLLRTDELNIFKRFSAQNQNRVREIMIKMVLATDMFYHAQNMQQMQRIIEKTYFDPQIEISNNQRLISEEELQTNKVFLLGQTLHLSDISNPCRDWKVCSKWTDLVFREFFYQGDLERTMGLPISNLMDRKTINIAQSQVGFINYLVIPVFTEYSKICINIEPLLRKAQANRQQWEDLKDVFEMHKEAGISAHINQDLGGFEGDYFSYENYKLRKQEVAKTQSQTQTTAPTLHHLHTANPLPTSNGLSPNNKSLMNLSVRNPSNQRISFLARKSSIRSGTKILHSQQNHESEIGVFVLKEENSNEQSSSDSGKSSVSKNDSLLQNSALSKSKNQDINLLEYPDLEDDIQNNQIIAESSSQNAKHESGDYLTKVSFLTKSNEDIDQDDYDQQLAGVGAAGRGDESLLHSLSKHSKQKDNFAKQAKQSSFSTHNKQQSHAQAIALQQQQLLLHQQQQQQMINMPINSHRFNLRESPSGQIDQNNNGLQDFQANVQKGGNKRSSRSKRQSGSKKGYQQVIDLSVSQEQEEVQFIVEPLQYNKTAQNMDDVNNQNNYAFDDINHDNSISNNQHGNSPSRWKTLKDQPRNHGSKFSALGNEQQIIHQQKSTVQKIVVSNHLKMMDRSGNIQRQE